MKKILANIVIVISFASISFAESEVLQIFLLRETVTESEIVNLGMVSVIHGDVELANEIANVGLGILSMPGQKLVFDQNLIATRLLASGFQSNEYELLGAKEISISRQETTISADDFIKAAQAFISDYLKENDVADARVLSMPARVVLGGKREDVKLMASWSSKGSKNRISIRVDVLKDGRRVGSRNVDFRLRYKITKAFAIEDISAGTVLTKQNVRIKEVLSDDLNSQIWQNPYGKVASRNILANKEIIPAMTQKQEVQMIVKRNQLIDIKYETPILFVSALGQALQDGCEGEIIKVANVKMDDKGKIVQGRVIVARVQPDGTLSPLY